MAYEDERDPQDPHDRQDAEDWVESTEGDLDPELTEEAGYLAWEPPGRGNNWWPFLWKVSAFLLVVALIGSAVLPALT